MRSIRYASIAALLILLPLSDVFAKDVCVSNSPQPANGSGRIVFRNVKKLKPGKVIPLTGLWFDGFGNKGPVDGTAIMSSDEQVRFGVTVYRTGISAYTQSYTATLAGDGDFNAAGGADNDGDNQNELAYTWTNIDCDSLTIP